MAPAAKDSKAAGAKAGKATAKSKAATTKKETTAATPKKGRKRAADLMEESAPAHIDAPAKQAKKDGARKAKAKAKEDAAVATVVAVEVAQPKAKKAKTTKSSDSTAAAKAEEKETKPAKLTKKKAETDAAKTKKAAPKSPAKKDAEDADAKPKKASKAKDAAATEGAAPKPRKRKASTLEDADGKAKSVVVNAAKKQKTDEKPGEESQSLLGMVGASLQAASKRMSGLFTVLSGGEEPNGTKKEKKAATKKSSSKAKAAPSGEETAIGDHEGALDLADSDIDIQDDDPAAAFLRGFESSDEEAASGDEGFAPGKPLPKLPNSKNLAKKLKGAADKAEPGVVYIGRIPHGFHEHEMRAYFSQFGTVDHVRLSRSKKTGASKHYAFLQFASADVAKIAAETMNNYLMFGHILKCHVIPPQQVHSKLWVGADRRFKAVPWNKIQGRKLEEPKGRSEWQEKIDAEAKRRATKAKKLQAMGYEFEAPALKNASDVPARPKMQVEQSTTVITTAENARIIEAQATEVSSSRVLPAAESAETNPAQAAVDEAVKASAKAGKRGKKAAAKVKA